MTAPEQVPAREQSDVEMLLAAAAYAVRRHLAAHPTATRHREDLFGDACVGAAAVYSRYDPAGGASLFTYALRRATGAITDGVRLRSPITRGEYKDAPDPHAVMALRTPASLEQLAADGWAAASTDNPFADSDDRDQVLRLLQRCSPTEQLVLLAVVMHGFSQTDVASWLGLSLARINQVHRRALERLRAAVG